VHGVNNSELATLQVSRTSVVTLDAIFIDSAGFLLVLKCEDCGYVPQFPLSFISYFLITLSHNHKYDVVSYTEN
jgi:hypothetical protein